MTKSQQTSHHAHSKADISGVKPVFGKSLAKEDMLRHGFFTREGGVSEGIYKSLNMGLNSQDDHDKVIENRRRGAAWFDVESSCLLTPHQFHSNKVVIANSPWDGEIPQGDAVVTNKQGLAIGVMTADCGVVLLYDPQMRIIGAAHAGWRGALAGIVENTVQAMANLGSRPSDIIAVSGPSIGPESYEVGAEFRQEFIDKNASYAKYFTPWTGLPHNLPEAEKDNRKPTYHCDLWTYIHDRLAEQGVEQIEDMNICTYKEAGRFYSFRRATPKGEKDYGRELSAICLL